MREIPYKTFSLRTHKINWRKEYPNVCQFELTFRCGLHCKHCYTDCYNKPNYFKKDLDTEQVKHILDKLYKSRVIWLCFTGGDPLARRDFLDIYSYAKHKGFIITIFTSGYFLTPGIADYFKQRPPFVIEMTLNAVSKELFEKITQVKGSFIKVMRGIGLALKSKLALKIKTQITKDNFKELERVRNFIEGLGLRFIPDFNIYARLNGDSATCNLRVSPEKILALKAPQKTQVNTCQSLSKKRKQTSKSNLFRCAIGRDNMHIDPYGNAFLCSLIRKPTLNLLKSGVEDALDKLLPLVENRGFTTDTRCKSCNLRKSCNWCPGKAYVETGNLETPIDYYCKLAGYTV
ncbi:MAG: radical SAM protein [Candidatus Omnitrophica bacterium]|nr:radical SAM protein [Candidatus Omnitrophota bacterium]MDD5237702.1 radical SAM protein [Candidatus Omnitrophota bacterium]